ncbi:MAG: OFA family MFS transporter [Oscillospiraceae bacterium]|nr:OFA family MFS transporter [Oscillospiraceae bacterium]
MENHKVQKQGNVVLIACILFNLIIQVLYIWSLLKVEMMSEAQGGWGWTSQQAGLPYTLVLIFFAVGVLIGGRVQDKIGPRRVATVGGVMVGLGMVLSGLVGENPVGVAIAFGVITGLGIGFGYGSVLPASMKWFHPSKKGLIGGLVLGGFGLATIHYAFTASALLDAFGIENTMLYIGIAVAVLSALVAQFVKNPPPGYVPAVPKSVKDSAITTKTAIDFKWREMLKTKRFYYMFVLFIFSASMGLMILGNQAKIAHLQAGISNAVFLMSIAAIMNAAGRILGGSLSDKIGRNNTLFIAIILQMLNMIGFIFYNNPVTITLGFILVGLCFGTFLAVFPALTADQYGLKNYGVNYGIVYLAYGFAGIVAPVIADYFFDLAGSFTTTYIICAVMMAFMIGLNLLLKREISKQLLR